jgi:hypothetical protein
LTFELAREIKAFNEYQQALIDQVSLSKRYANYASPVESQLTPLREGQLRIAVLREQLADIQEELRDPAAEEREQLKRDLQADADARAAAVVNELVNMRP